MSIPQYSVSWDAYQKSICSGLSGLQQRGEFVDMTIAADGHYVKVHQMVMSLVSPYIQELISSAACPHPVIFFNQVSYQTLQAILQYAYTGQVVVSNEDIREFFAACRELRIRGMEDATSADLAHDASETDALNNTEWQSSHTPRKKRYDVSRTELTDGDLTDNAGNDADDTVIEDHLDNDDSMVDSFDSELQRERPNLSQDNDIGTRETSLSYSISNMGSVQAVLNRNLFCLRSKRKNGDILWRCLSYARGKCRACIVIRGNKVIKRSCAHNHPFHDAQILKRLRNRNMFATLTDVEGAIHRKRNPEGNYAKVKSVDNASE